MEQSPTPPFFSPILVAVRCILHRLVICMQTTAGQSIALVRCPLIDCAAVSEREHDRPRHCRLDRQSFEVSGEHARPALALGEPLARAIFPGRIAPLQPIALDEYYLAQNTPVIDPWLAVAVRKIRSTPLHLLVDQPEKSSLNSPLDGESETPRKGHRKPRNGA